MKASVLIENTTRASSLTAVHGLSLYIETEKILTREPPELLRIMPGKWAWTYPKNP